MYLKVAYLECYMIKIILWTITKNGGSLLFIPTYFLKGVEKVLEWVYNDFIKTEQRGYASVAPQLFTWKVFLDINENVSISLIIFEGLS